MVKYLATFGAIFLHQIKTKTYIFYLQQKRPSADGRKGVRYDMIKGNENKRRMIIDYQNTLEPYNKNDKIDALNDETDAD